MKLLVIGASIVAVLVVAFIIAFAVLVIVEERKVQADPKDFAAVQVGQTQEQAEGIIGDTDSNFKLTGAGDPPSNASCLFYLNKDNKDNGFRLCYQDGKLIDKKEFKID